MKIRHSCGQQGNASRTPVVRRLCRKNCSSGDDCQHQFVEVVWASESCRYPALANTLSQLYSHMNSTSRSPCFSGTPQLRAKSLRCPLTDATAHLSRSADSLPPKNCLGPSTLARLSVVKHHCRKPLTRGLMLQIQTKKVAASNYHCCSFLSPCGRDKPFWCSFDNRGEGSWST